MRRNEQYQVQCVFTRGPFPHERAFWITDPSGNGYYRGLAYIGYCFAIDGVTQLPDDEPPHGSKIEGRLVVRVLEKASGGLVTVEVPSGETCDIRQSQLIEVAPYVPVGS